jgi:hypothetical protein
MQVDPKTLVLAALAFVAVFETLRRLNEGHVKGIEKVPLRPVEVAQGPGGLQP